MSILMIYCFFNHPATTEIYTYLHTLSLPDSLPIYGGVGDDDERRPGLRQKLRHLGLHRHAVFAVADADQHRRRRRVDRLRSPERGPGRSEEHTSELQSLMRISYAVFCLKKKKNTHKYNTTYKLVLSLRL